MLFLEMHGDPLVLLAMGTLKHFRDLQSFPKAVGNEVTVGAPTGAERNLSFSCRKKKPMGKQRRWFVEAQKSSGRKL